MQVVHTAALPPNHGRMYFAMSGCTRKSRNALQKMVTPNGSMDGVGKKGRPVLVVVRALGYTSSADDNILRRRQRRQKPEARSQTPVKAFATRTLASSDFCNFGLACGRE